jgi:hypothetical protein
MAGGRRGKDDRKQNALGPFPRGETSANKQQQQHFVLQIFICKLVWKNEAAVDLKVHKRENFFGFDSEFYTFL